MPAAAPGTGRTVQLHPQEALLQQPRAPQRSEAFGEYRQCRVVVEHRLARLVQLGIRQARYFGRIKTGFQLYLAATVANLPLVASKAGLAEDTGGASSVGSALRAGTIRSAFDVVPARLGLNLDLGLAYVGLTAEIHLPGQGFPARFLVAALPAGWVGLEPEFPAWLIALLAPFRTGRRRVAGPETNRRSRSLICVNAFDLCLDRAGA